MASTAKKQPIEDESAIGTAAANDNVEVKNASGSQGAKVINFKGNKIELDIDNPSNLVSTSKAANDNVVIREKLEKEKKPDSSATSTNEFEPEKTEGFDNIQSPKSNFKNTPESKSVHESKAISPHNVESENEDPKYQKWVNQQKKAEDDGGNQFGLNKSYERYLEDKAENEDPEYQKWLDKQKQAEKASGNGNVINKSYKRYLEDKAENEGAKEQPPQPQNTTTPPTVNKEALEQTGPHTSTNRTPNTIPTGEQKGVANAMSQPRGIAGLGAAGLGTKMGEGAANKIKGGVTDNKEQTKNITAGIANNLQSDRNIKRNLKKEREKIKTKLDTLERTVDGMKTNPAMLILRTISPSLYSQLTSLTIGKNLIKLQLNLVTLKTIKRMLRSMAAFVDYAESLFNVNKVGLATTEVIIGFFIIALSVFISIPLFIFKFGTNTGKLSKAITVVIKDIIDPMVEKIEQLIEPLKKRTELRKRFQNINVLLAGTKDERQQDLEQKNQQATKQRTETRGENEWKGYKRAPKIAK